MMISPSLQDEICTLLPSARIEIDALQGLPSYGIEIEFDAGKKFSSLSLEKAAAQTGRFVTPYCVPKHRFVDNQHWSYMEEDSVSGGEFVSPVFRNNIKMREISEMLKIIKDAGGTTSASTGIHVHVNVAPLTTPQAWYDLFHTFQYFQTTLYAVASSPLQYGHHRASDSVKPITMLRMARDTAAWSSIALSYMKKNCALTSFNASSPSTGTLEFRLWDGSLNDVLVGFYIAVSIMLVMRASEGALSAPQSIHDLGGVLFPQQPTLARIFYLLSAQPGHPALS